MAELKASVVVVVHAGEARLDDALASLAPYRDGALAEVILVDNGSADRCAGAAARRYPWAKVRRSETNLGFAGGAHFGAEVASGEILVFLNDDAVAEEGFVEGHLAALAALPRAAASAGRLVSWDGRSHDFVRGAVTFDCHAFQLGQGCALDEVAAPAEGEPLPFACGGNMAIRRSSWQRHGGFDRELFAYFEDVELGWRLWASGEQVVAAPQAVARHRGSATSAALGDFRRGVLFERNALRCFFGCADEEMRSALGTAVLATFLHRLVHSTQERPELAAAAADPFAETVPGLTRRARWRRRLDEKGIAGSLRHLLARVLLGPRVGQPQIDDGRLLMQLRAAHGFFAGLDGAEARRAELAAMRTVSDREILARFPRLIVPTYPGDLEWFDSVAFQGMLPTRWSLQRRALEDILHHSVLHR